MDYLFITGAARSGTTLTDKLCHNLPSVSVASQPYFQFYIDVRKAFMKAVPEVSETLPLSHHFPALPGWQDRFRTFLGSNTFSGGELTRLIERSTQGKGQGTPGLVPQTPNADSASFMETWRSLMRSAALRIGPPGERVTGSKEIYCEDFVPFLADQGVKCIICIRDLRDVLTSMNHGRYIQQTEKRYPLLVNIRNWRKSVATALAMQEHPNVMIVRYEDMVGDRSACYRRFDHFLGGYGAQDRPPEPLLGQDGTPWSNNSSFTNTATDGDAFVGRWRSSLQPELVRLVELLAGPELAALGYIDEFSVAPLADLFERNRENDDDLRTEYLNGERLDDSNLALEHERLHRLKSPDTQDDERWFLYPAAADALRRGTGWNAK